MPAKRQTIIPPGMENIYETYHYAPGVRVGNHLYIAGQVGRDRDLNVIADPEAQFAQAFENVKLVLDAAGAGFDDVVELVSYHTEMTDLPLFMRVKDRYMVRDYPTWTGFEVTRFSMPGLRVELKCTAYLDD